MLVKYQSMDAFPYVSDDVYVYTLASLAAALVLVLRTDG